MIESLLGVVDPMLMQSEKVAASGMGDAGQVASAQRTVSMIRVTHSDVAKNWHSQNLHSRIILIQRWRKLLRIIALYRARLRRARPHN
jgi:hypothetical protein